MTMWGRVRSWLAVPTPLPAVTFSDPTPRPIDQMFMDLRGLSGSVSRGEALSVPAIQKGRNLLCSIASLPLVQKGPDNTVVRNPLLEQIDPDIANVVTMAMTVEDLVFDAVAWWRITGFGFDMYPVTAERLDPATVSVDPPHGRTRSPLPSGEDPRKAAGVWVSGKWVPASEIIRFDSPNPAVLKVCGRSIRRAVLFDQAARTYADNTRMIDYFTAAPDAGRMEDEDVEEFLDEWQGYRRRSTTGYVPPELEYKVPQMPTPADLQLVQLQQQVGLDLANALGVDPEDLGISTTSRTYANIIDRRVDRINDVYAPYMRAITDRLSMTDVTKNGYRIQFDLTDYLKSNPTERWAVYEKAKNLGVWDANDIRRKEGEPPMAEPANSPQPADSSEEPATETPAESQSVDASGSVLLQFKQQKSHQFTFTDEGDGFEFKVDTDTRTIAGLALPWNKVGVKYGLKFRFKPNSLQFAETSRVKHFKDHVTPVGKALDLKSTRGGFMAKLSVGNGPTGDELLQLADDGIYDGLSVGVDFSLDPDDGDVVLARDGVYDVIRADLREISTTAMPAFDDARVTKVAASRDGGDMTETATSGQETAAADPAPTPPAATSVEFSAEQLAALRTQLGIPAPAPEPRPVVNPTRLTASVSEAVPYRFDQRGNLTAGAHDFSADLHAWFTNHDQAAHDRALSFIQAQFDIATGDVNELNPVPTRPDMYVDQRQFRYPIWDAISKGTLGSITPFIFPKFNSAAGLVGNHTEGVEPSSGTLTTTSQTVTPTGVSGKAKITREVWDQGGNPQVSNLIWQKMVQGWYEALEAAAVATLDAATPTAIALTAGAADDVLVDELTAALTLLQFVRGGFSMDMAPTQVDLYKKLAAAEDSTGRPLLPPVGPMNSVGTAQPRYAGLDVNGVLFTPAWALAASGSVVASSYLFDRAVVHGWASAPQKLDITLTEVAHVYIGLWGYRAAAISDIAGVREITYDPVA